MKMTTKYELKNWMSKKKEWTGDRSFPGDASDYSMLLVAAAIDGRIQIFKPDLKFKNDPSSYNYYDFSSEVVKWIKHEQTKKVAVDKIYEQIKQHFGVK